ncbi:type I 3-dehydroquinate dehydratase [Acidiplasma sp.]|uniref:type I 3-dehydroquinate dehydratase n=1 Tax=Acidiplasma sp. TaxID=1872114 RepID=UPI003167B2D3
MTADINNLHNIYISIYFKSFNELKNAFDSGILKKNNNYEIRFDLFELNDKNPENIISYMNENKINYIFTYRGSKIADIIKVYSYAFNRAPIIDIDISNFYFKRDDFQKSRLMLSYHGNNNDDVKNILKKMEIYNPDIYKIALNYNDYEKFLRDLLIIMDFKKRTNKEMAFIPMGDKNSFLRIFSLMTVSDIGYAKFKESTAPGQLTLDNYNEIFEILKH